MKYLIIVVAAILSYLSGYSEGSQNGYELALKYDQQCKVVK